MQEESMQGVVIFSRSNEGSKSECSLPHLYRGKDEPLVTLYKEDDNPFENGSLLVYDGQRVEVSGNSGSDNDFIVTSIKNI